jgi:hypothetical protein
MKFQQKLIIIALILFNINALLFAKSVMESSNLSEVELSQLPLLTINNLEYIGGFRIKKGSSGDSRIGFTDGKIAYNNKHHSLFITGFNHDNAIAEFSIPPLVNSDQLEQLPISQSRQEFSTIFLRSITDNPQKLNRIGGMEYIRGQLLVHAYEYYDANNNNTHTSLVIRQADNLKKSPIDGFFKLLGKAHQILWISPIPKSLQVLLGGDYISGASSSMPINGRASMGPSAFVLNSVDIIDHPFSDALISTIKLLDFSLTHIMSKTASGWLPFSQWKGRIQYNYSGKRPAGKEFPKVYNKSLVTDNDLWTEESSAHYGLLIPNTRTYAVFGYSGMHHSGGGYKITQNNGYLCAGPCPYDPKDKDNYYWFFDIKDLLAVKQGKKFAYEVKPYQYGVFNTAFNQSLIQGGTFNSEDGIIYFSLPKADKLQSRYEPPPIILAYKIKL